MTAAGEERILALDVIRGIAVIGILLLNIVGFAMPSQAYLNPLAYRGDGALDIALWVTNFVFADGKMRTLFTMLFGASLLLVAQRAEAAGESLALTSYARLTWLLLFGAIHAYAIWYGDILMLYAAIGMLAFLLRGLDTHKLVIAGLVLIVVQAAWFGQTLLSWWHLSEIARMPGAPTEIAEQWHWLETAFGPPRPDMLADDLALHRGAYAGLLADRLGPGFWRPITANFSYGFETLGMMLLGMAGLKSGFLTGGWSRRGYARTVAIGYLVSIPLLAGLALWLLADGFGALAVFAGEFVIKTLVNPVMALAHAALILIWIGSGAAAGLRVRVAAAGRMAFTNYIATSLICTTLFYGYGFGLYGHLDRAALYLVVIAVCAAMLLWSKPWLDRFRYGPLEWLWRSLARRELQPMRRSA